MRDYPAELKKFLRDLVVAQDYGYAMGEEFQKAFIPQMLTDALAVAAHEERLRMVNEGFDVYAPPKEASKHFTLGLDPWPYKKGDPPS